MTHLSPRGTVIARGLAANLRHLAEHDKVSPAEVDTIYRLLVEHVRSARPQMLLSEEGKL